MLSLYINLENWFHSRLKKRMFENDLFLDTVPELQYTFIEQALRPGPPVSLRCSATGSPTPSFTWLLDGEPLSQIATGHR